LYRKENLPETSIEEFLGHAAHDPIVYNSKLTNVEKNVSDKVISLEELTKSLNESKFKSAAEIDMYSNRFIMKFFLFFWYHYTDVVGW
jgi:hypothetical protein